MQSKTNEIASKYLGKKTDGSDFYNPSFIVTIPREENRRQYNIDNKNLPFFGFDIWHAYEFSALTENNLPVTRVLKIKYNCESEFLVESKSLKLYLNSFNMSKFGRNINECLEICKNKIEKDLSEKLKTEVQVNFLDNSTERVEIFEDFQNLMELVDESKLKIEKFKEAPEVLQIEDLKDEKSYYLTYASLRSNCRVTHQPDFGDVFIYYKSKKHILEDSLVKYMVSFRSEFHFHEECCEMIYKRLSDILSEGDELLISALYTRRGGIDICPSRWSKNTNSDKLENLLDITKLARCGIKQ